ncbi:cellulose synthase-like protein G3 [Coffea eugenioides]|uniref:cellulose synthase-like protein G3 n=1 Tax=Coffea eugenioides TaxID=49369 RepID=UPI000F613FA9|nr:cellulose synthase-like protein G3 [Coffea eugenioides]
MEPSTMLKAPFHSIRSMRRTVFNHLFAVVYTIALLFLLYHHAFKLFSSTTFPSFFISISMFISDLLLAFLWFTAQGFRIRPVTREVFPENLEEMIDKKDFPAIDIFICTSDPYKEPPIDIVNTALSVMAYDYPTEKLSIYVSDDGGSELTLFAIMEAAKFGAHWLAFCRENKVLDRSPAEFFRLQETKNSKTEKIKIMYEDMKRRIETVVENGKVAQYITSQQEHEAFSPWTKTFTRRDHPTVIQVLLQSGKDIDVSGHSMPNLIYVTREKSITSPHHYKAGALNTLLRVSALMTNAPIILTLDCDMFSNNPRTPYNVLCYFMDNSIRPKLAYVQFPQCFHGVNKNDIYSSEMQRGFHINTKGMDGLTGPHCMGTGCFFMRRALFGGPSAMLQPEMPQLSPDHVVSNPIRSQHILELAKIVAGCNYEFQTNWGEQMGFRYGSLVEDLYTGYRLHCQGWKSIFCQPQRAAFLGNIPISLLEALNQVKRWAVGHLQFSFSKYSPLTFGIQAMGGMSLDYIQYGFLPLWSVSITIYTFLPQLTLLNGIYIFPKVTSPWFFLYAFLFLGAYAQDCLEFLFSQATLRRWWSEQRIWLIRGLTCYLFGTLEYLMQILGIATHGFNVTSKAVDDEQSKRYYQGLFEFGVPSPIFLPLATAAIISFAAFLYGTMLVLKGGNTEDVFIQLFIAGFGVLNCLPIYEAMIIRTDKGKMPTKTTITSIIIASGLYLAAFLMLQI